MLDDRSYMRSETGRNRWSATTILLALNAVCFLIQSLAGFYTHFPVNEYFALSTDGLRNGFVWQLVTFQFMHAGLFHLLFNCIAIYFFGRAIEETVGQKTFLKLYFASGIIGGLVQILGALVLPSHFGAAVMGASAGAFGLIAAFATLFPDRSLTMLLFFIIPINMRAKYLLIFSAAFAIFGILIPNDNVAHAAHLGGMLAGIFYIRAIVLSHRTFSNWRPFGRAPSVRELVNANAAKRPSWRKPKSAPPQSDELPPAEFISQEVDPILDKISAHGIHSLTERERQILDAARKKMAKR